MAERDKYATSSGLSGAGGQFADAESTAAATYTRFVLPACGGGGGGESLLFLSLLIRTCFPSISADAGGGGGLWKESSCRRAGFPPELLHRDQWVSG